MSTCPLIHCCLSTCCLWPLQAEEADFTADLHGNWTLENAKSRLHQFMQTNHIKADYKYSVVGPDHCRSDIWWSTDCALDWQDMTVPAARRCISLTSSAVVSLIDFDMGLEAAVSFVFHFNELRGWNKNRSLPDFCSVVNDTVESMQALLCQAGVMSLWHWCDIVVTQMWHHCDRCDIIMTDTCHIASLVWFTVLV